MMESEKESRMLAPSALKNSGGSRVLVGLALALIFSMTSVSIEAQQWPTGNTDKPVTVNSIPDARLANGGVIAMDSAGSPDFIWRTLQAIAVIVAIAGVGIGGLVLVRRFAPGVIPGTDARMKVLTRIPMGNRQSMVIVKIGERVLVVGASPGRIDCLSEITDFDEVQDLSYGSEFSHQIEKIRNDTEDDQYQVVNVEDSASEDVRNEIQWLRDRLDGYGDRVEGETQT